MEAKHFHRRLAALGTLFALCLAVFLYQMYDAQIVHVGDYRAQSERTYTRPETVEASRGIITDRNGRVLVSNHVIYTLAFDDSLTDGETVNSDIARLLTLFDEYEIDWDDLLPVTREAPFAYDFSASRAKTHVDYLAEQKWLPAAGFTEEELPAVLSAPLLVARLRTEYGVDPALGEEAARAIVGVRYSAALTRANSGGTFTLASDVSVELISLLKDGGYRGVRVGTASERVYETDAAAHILGRVGKIADWDSYKDQGYAMDDLVGRDGVEYAFEDYLRGTDGKRIITTNADGKVISELYSIDPRPGDTVALTLDIDYQAQVESIIASAAQSMTADDGIDRGSAAAVVQVGTGDILALASYPTYSLKNFQEDYETLRNDPMTPMVNRATHGLYPPGSTFKPLVAVAALENGIISPSTRIRDTGRYTYYDMVFYCWIYSSRGGSHGLINVTDAITVSCNVFFYEVGRMTGITTLARYAAAFGLGEPTGIELPENIGTMTTPDYVNSLEGHRWTDGLTLQAAIGQAYDLFTPLQLANYIATLAGGGDRYAAHLLKDVRAYDSAAPVYVYDEPPVEEIEISGENLNAVLSGMRKLVTSGSVRTQFQKCIVDAAAKTGTAQTGSSVSNGVFVCFAPYDDPQIAVALVIEKGGSGGALAASAVEILNAWFTVSGAETGITGENALLK